MFQSTSCDLEDWDGISTTYLRPSEQFRGIRLPLPHKLGVLGILKDDTDVAQKFYPALSVQRDTLRPLAKSRVIGKAILGEQHARPTHFRGQPDSVNNPRRLFTTNISLYPMLPSHIASTIALLLTLQTVTAWRPALSDLSPWLSGTWVRRSTNARNNDLQRRANQTVWISSDVYHGETFFEYASRRSVNSSSADCCPQRL